ncbi:MAG: hypothetical protein PHH96_05990 [Smithellaceae bacterium]|jgi:hypothetical protein|nr:hypothetical protein [Smithellaceae bacterium]
MKSSLSNSEPHRLTKFKEMIAIGSFCVLLMLVISGCATVAVDPGVGFIPNEQEGVVFGQMQLLIDGNLVRYDGKRYFGAVWPQKVVTHISPYSDGQLLNMNPLLPGKLAFATQIADDGYFSAKLPAGRYYVNEFGYYLPNYLSFPKGCRTYMYYMGVKPSDLQIVLFDVLPNKATYIGTFIHRSDTGDNKKTIFKLRVINEFDTNKTVFLAKHPMADESIVSEIATFIPFENQKQKAKGGDSADQTKKAQATKAAIDEFNSVAGEAGIAVDHVTVTEK